MQELALLEPDNPSEALFQRLFRKHSSIMLLIDPSNGRIKDANRAAADFYGYAEDVLRTMRVSQINVLPDEEIRQEMQRAMQEQRNYFIFRHRLSSGELRTVEVHSSAIEARGTTLLFSIVFDITERKRAEEQLRLASLVYRNSSEAMSVVDANGMIMTVNPAFTEITGYSAEEAIGRHMSLIDSPRATRKIYRAMRRTLDENGRWTGELWGRRRNGQEFLRWLSISTIYNDDGSVQSRVGLFSDITRRREADEMIWRQANFDALTDLPNRSMFRDRLEQAIKKAHRADQQVALLFLDLDSFKEINDTLGHAVGDRVLQAVAQRLQRCVRDSDTVARLGGDEFTVIIGELAEKNSIERVAQQILHVLSDPFHIGGEQLYASASIGITFYPDDGTRVDELLKHADQAMYAAKAQGRNCYSYFTRAMQEAALTRKRLVTDLRRALAEGEFCLHYQPIVDLATGAVHKAEALVRWNHPARGLVSPSEFIAVAEETGIIGEIGDWVFREAVRQACVWRAGIDPDFQISINVSPAQFLHGGRDSGWIRRLEEIGLPGAGVVLEITEGLLMDGRPETIATLLHLRGYGIQIALDDFGTGYSSLAYLKKFRIDFIKIDQSFVRNLAPGSDDLALCEAMIVMAHKLGIRLVAEGVETEAQRGLLAANGCDHGQGYLFARPLPAAAFEEWMRRGKAPRPATAPIT
ncbi:MAG TPA: EAL domain-containing protein [Noviherbaspirillum sp.]|nr:EAL domain-containing protein [Noviherbaspirillum sp.]